MGITLLPNSVQGGMTQIAKGTLAGTPLTLTGIPQIYKNLYIEFDNIQGTSNGAEYYVYWNSVTSGYYSTFIQTNSTTTVNQSNVTIVRFSGFDNSTANFMYLKFFSYSNPTISKIVEFKSKGGNSQAYGGHGQNSDTGAISTIYVGNSTGAAYTGGTYTIYGVE